MSKNSIQETVSELRPYLENEERLLYTQVVVGLLRKTYIGVTTRRVLLKDRDLQSISFEEITDFLKGESRLFFFFNDKKDGVLTEETVVLNNVSKIQEVYRLIFKHWRKLRPEINELSKSEQIKLLEHRMTALSSELDLKFSEIEGMYKKYEGQYKDHALLIKVKPKMPISEFSIELMIENAHNLHFNLSKEPDMLSDWRDWFGRSELKTGDKKFDDQFYLISDNVQLSKRLFTPSVKRAMHYCQNRADCVWLLGDGVQKKETSERLFSTEGNLNDIEDLLDDMLVKERQQTEEEEAIIISPLRFTASLGVEIQENGGKIADLIEKAVEHVFEMVEVVDGYYGRRRGSKRSRIKE